jgi:hypothetical protein
VEAVFYFESACLAETKPRVSSLKP